MSWPVVALGDLVDIRGGGTPSKQKPEYWGGAVPWASVKDFRGAELNETTDYITTLGVEKSATNIIPAGNIIVPTRMALGKVAINIVDMAINQDLKALIVRNEKVLDKNYLKRFLEEKADFIEGHGKGATVKGITLDVLRKLEVPVPPIREQKRIATILDKADAIRRKRQQAIQLADEFLRAVFLDMFGDPVTNPKGFKKIPVSQLADIITGFAFKSNDYISDSEQAVRLCRGVNTLTGYFDWSETVFWSKCNLEKLDRYLIKSGDIILAMDRPWISSGLKVCVFPENQRDTYLVQRVARLRPHRESYKDYIYSSIKSKSFEKHCCPTETTVPHISPIELKEFEVLLPSSELIDKYGSVASKVKSNLDRMINGNCHGEKILSALSERAFTGLL